MLNENQIQIIRQDVDENHKELLQIIDALSDKRRFQIFKLFIKHGQFCVTDIAKIFNITAAASSQQLKIMEQTGILKKERVGQTICYSLTQDSLVKEFIQFIAGKQKKSFFKFFLS
ncbi:MAG: winged helix-turn-helix transcriptional regulator [Parcubacteria group bacterium]|nr:winged helix-turn-helix transcriptional regulator [Parcubacteria group bacterium]